MDEYDFLRDVLEAIPELDVEREEWDDNMPGMSGYDYRLELDHPDSARRAIRQRVDALSAAQPHRQRT